MFLTWRLGLFICLFALALPHQGAWGAQTAQPPSEVAVWEDPSGAMGIEQAASKQLADKYRTWHGNRMSMGFCRSALWIRMPLSEAPDRGPWALEVNAPWMDRVDWYLPRPEGGWWHRSTGLSQPGENLCHWGFALSAPAEAPQSGFSYLRLQSVLSLNAGLGLWSRTELDDQAVKQGYLYGILYGIMAAMVLANMFVLAATRDRAYLLYVLYQVSIIIHQLCLQGQVLFLPAELWEWVPGISLFVSSAVFFFGAAFCRVFLNAKHYAPWPNRLLWVMQGVALVLLGLTLSGQIWWGTWLAHFLALVGPLVAIAAGCMAWAQGFRPARFYLVAWVVLLLGAMAWGAWSMGWQPLVFLPKYALTIAAALESILLSMALADRVGVIHKERQMLAQRERRYRQMSVTDELTGLFNARYFWSKLGSEIEHAHNLGQPLGLVLLDVDNFKRFNDSYGHPEGDKVLSHLGLVLREGVRPADTACRYGGEEFALLLPGAGDSTAQMVAERVRKALACQVFLPEDGSRETVTISLGTAQLLPGDDPESLVRRADKALYQAKAEGKNRVACAG